MKKNQLLSLIGNILEHYDKALYALLAPFLAPLFFGEKDVVFSLIMTYALIPLGMLIKPLGAFFLGSLADQKGQAFCLKISLWGTALSTLCMGLLPTYQDCGAISSFLLISCKLLQSFFSSSETVSSAVFVMEQTSVKKRTILSSLIDSTSIFGMLLASSFLVFFTQNNLLDSCWRWLFVIGSLTFVIPFFLKQEKVLKIKNSPSILTHFKTLFKSSKQELLPLILIFGFSSMTFHLAFTFLSGFCHTNLDFSLLSSFQINNLLLVLDILFLMGFALMADKWGKANLMKISSLALGLTIPFLFQMMKGASFYEILVFRLIFVLLGSAFSCSVFAFCLEKLNASNKTTLLAIGSSLGSQLIGAPSISLCFYLNKTFATASASAISISIISLLAFSSVHYLNKKSNQSQIN